VFFPAKLTTKPKEQYMFPIDILARIYEVDKSSAINLMLTAACVEKMETKDICAAGISNVYETFSELSKKIAKQIDDGDANRRLLMESDSLKKISSSLPQISYGSSSGNISSSPSSPKMRPTPR
jgi:hypothetical protein